MDGTVIKSFLVGLGFSVDDSELATFNKSIASAALRVTALYGTIQVAAAGIFKGVTGIAEGFEELGYSTRLIAPAINKTLLLRNALFEAYNRAGIDLVKVVKESVIFNLSLAKTKFALEAIYKSVGSKFIPVLTKQLDVFRGKIYANMPKIQESLERMIKFLLKAFEATTILGGRIFSILGRVYDFFKDLDTATDGWSTRILAVVAAWKLLNLSFLATPLGLLITGLTALLALYDDYKTAQEGGESLFDWKALQPAIDSGIKAFQELYGAMKSALDIITSLLSVFKSLFTMDWSGAVDGLEDALESLGEYVGHIMGLFTNLGGVISQAFGGLGSIKDKVSGLFGGSSGTPQAENGAPAQGAAQAVSGFFSNPNVATNASAQNNPTFNGPSNPVGSTTQNNSSKQSLNQETSIYVQGSADANSTGKAVASQQNRVNFDMARNMRGATR